MFHSLSHFQKFQEGSSLWMIFFEPERSLFKEINWRTGFLLQKPKEKPDASKPVLIDTKNIFPNQSLLCLPFRKDSWSGEAYQNWKKMDKPSFRIFIPLGFSEESLNKAWPSADKFCSLSYYKEV